MMKKTNIGPLMLLLLLAVIPRDCSANSIALADVSSLTVNVMIEANLSNPTVNESNGANPIVWAFFRSPTVNKMIEGVEILIQRISWLQENIQNTHFDETIRQLERDVKYLPIELEEERRKMLEGLYRSQARINITKSVLEQAALKLKSYCDDLLEIYDSNDVSMELINYTVKKFVKYANFVKFILQYTSKKYIETSDEWSESKSLLMSFRYELNSKEREICDNHREHMGYLDTINMWITNLTIGIGRIISGPIINNIKNNARDIRDPLICKIDKVRNTLFDLFDQNEEITEFVMKEIILIDNWKYSLKASIDDHEELSDADIKFSIKMIKQRLIVLKEASIKYLIHKLPEILSTNNQTRPRAS